MPGVRPRLVDGEPHPDVRAMTRDGWTDKMVPVYGPGARGRNAPVQRRVRWGRARGRRPEFRIHGGGRTLSVKSNNRFPNKLNNRVIVIALIVPPRLISHPGSHVDGWPGSRKKEFQ
jgi:hypothetical protein